MCCVRSEYRAATLSGIRRAISSPIEKLRNKICSRQKVVECNFKDDTVSGGNFNATGLKRDRAGAEINPQAALDPPMFRKEWIMMRVSTKTIERRGMTLLTSAISQLSIEQQPLSPALPVFFRPFGSLDHYGNSCRISALVGGKSISLLSCPSRLFANSVHRAIKRTMTEGGDCLINVPGRDIASWTDPKTHLQKISSPSENLRSHASEIITGIDLMLYYSESDYVRPMDVFWVRERYAPVRAYAVQLEMAAHSSSAIEEGRGRLEKFRARAVKAMDRFERALDIYDPVPDSNWKIHRHIKEFANLELRPGMVATATTS